MGVDVKEAEKKVTETIKEAKKKNPSLVKWIIGIIGAAIMAGIGFFGGIFGLSEKQQSNLKQMFVSSSVYQEAIADEAATDATKTSEVKEEKKETAPAAKEEKKDGAQKAKSASKAKKEKSKK